MLTNDISSGYPESCQRRRDETLQDEGSAHDQQEDTNHCWTRRSCGEGEEHHILWYEQQYDSEEQVQFDTSFTRTKGSEDSNWKSNCRLNHERSGTIHLFVLFYESTYDCCLARGTRERGRHDHRQHEGCRRRCVPQRFRSWGRQRRRGILAEAVPRHTV